MNDERTTKGDATGDMIVFARVVKAGSLAKAAHELGVSRPVVSKRLRKLEERLGTRLLNRTTRSLSLTEAGRAFYDHCRDLDDRVAQAEAAVAALRDRPAGELRVSAPNVLGSVITRAITAKLLIDNPDLAVDLHLTDDFVDVVEGGFDVVIRIGKLQDSTLVAHKITDTRLVTCASPLYVKRHGAPATPKDLRNHECLVFSRRGSTANTWPFTGSAGRESVSVEGRFTTSSDITLKEAALNGFGIALTASFLIQHELETGALVVVLDDYCQEQRGVYALFASKKHLPLKVRVFVDFMDEVLGRSPPGVV